MSAVRPPARFGAIKISGNKVKYFKEKSKLDEGWINGGFFVIEKKFLKLIKNDKTFLEREPLEKACKNKQLLAFKHNGFWQCMDTMRDKIQLDIALKKDYTKQKIISINETINNWWYRFYRISLSKKSDK